MGTSFVVVRRINYKMPCGYCNTADSMAIVRDDYGTTRPTSDNWLVCSNPLVRPTPPGPPDLLMSHVYCRNCKVMFHPSVIEGKEIAMDSDVEAYNNKNDELSRADRSC